MQEWGYPPGDIYLHAAVRANPSARASWRRQDYELDFVAGAGMNAVTAVQKLFEPSSDFLARNLMMCDHTIHALHLEALVFAMTKRGRGSAWLDAEVAANGARWLRIQSRSASRGGTWPDPASRCSSSTSACAQADLQVGDHLIVYNHPAYAATTAGVWRLENAVVVQTFPELLMQGHGSAVLNQGAMWKAMIKYFRDELAEHRAAVDGLARIERFGPNTLVVNQSQFLRSGMRVDIVRDDAGEAVLAADRQIVSVSGRTVRYSGASVSAPGSSPAAARPRNALRRSEGSDRRQHVPPRAPDAAGDVAVRRAATSEPTGSSSGGRRRKKRRIRKDTARAAFVKAHHLVEYTREQESGKATTIGWFPLWLPATKGGSPVRRNGRIVSTDPVEVELRNVAGWTWFFDPNPAKRDLVPVIRPREL